MGSAEHSGTDRECGELLGWTRGLRPWPAGLCPEQGLRNSSLEHNRWASLLLDLNGGPRAMMFLPTDKNILIQPKCLMGDGYRWQKSQSQQNLIFRWEAPHCVKFLVIKGITAEIKTKTKKTRANCHWFPRSPWNSEYYIQIGVRLAARSLGYSSEVCLRARSMEGGQKKAKQHIAKPEVTTLALSVSKGHF